MGTLLSARLSDGSCCEVLDVVINVCGPKKPEILWLITPRSYLVESRNRLPFFVFSAQMWPVLARTWYKELRSGSGDLERNSQHVSLHREKASHDSQNGKLSCFDSKPRDYRQQVFSLAVWRVFIDDSRESKRGSMAKQGLRRAVAISRPNLFKFKVSLPRDCCRISRETP